MRLKQICESIEPSAVMAMLPTSQHAAFKKALGWQPRLQSQQANDDLNLNLVAAGKKPVMIMLQPTAERVQALRKKLSVYPSVAGNQVLAALPDNEDMIDLINWAYGRMSIDTPELHYIVGICLGYPIEEVKKFCQKYEDGTANVGLLKRQADDLNLFGG